MASVLWQVDDDFLWQEAPFLVADREAEWDEKVRRVPIYIRRQEIAHAAAAHGPLERCVQSSG